MLAQQVQPANGQVLDAAYFKNGTCGLTVEDAHISTYLLRTKKQRQVKVNVFSACAIPQQSVTFDVEIWKVGLYGDHLVKKFHKVITKSPNPKRFDFLESRAKCLNRLPTIYYGRGKATAVIKGKTYTSLWVISEHQSLIDCGT